MPRFIVTLDGPAGAGKSTVARELAKRLGFVLLDTGAIYRSVACLALERSISTDDDSALNRICSEVAAGLRFGEGRVWLGERDLTAAIREPSVSQAASKISARPTVRTALLPLQRALAAQRETVAEGRDTGTVVFPDAEAKFFLDATIEERARRRCLELQAAGRTVSFEETLQEIAQRDQRDRARDVAPLRAAPDAVIVDTTGQTIEAIIQRLESAVRAKMCEQLSSTTS